LLRELKSQIKLLEAANSELEQKLVDNQAKHCETLAAKQTNPSLQFLIEHL